MSQSPFSRVCRGGKRGGCTIKYMTCTQHFSPPQTTCGSLFVEYLRIPSCAIFIRSSKHSWWFFQLNFESPQPPLDQQDRAHTPGREKACNVHPFDDIPGRSSSAFIAALQVNITNLTCTLAFSSEAFPSSTSDYCSKHLGPRARIRWTEPVIEFKCGI